MQTDSSIMPVQAKERHMILDILRGIALLGICLANYSEFSLYTFQSAETVAAMPTAGVDRIVRYLQYIFIDGKFYTIFSLLFGIGFSIILSNLESKNMNGVKTFYRRMSVLMIIGLCHLVLLWAGDILMLYAFVGFFLPLFRKISNRKLLAWSAAFILLPIVADAFIAFFGLNPSASVTGALRPLYWWSGITESNFPTWLADHENYAAILEFNLGGVLVRLQELIDDNRAFKVLGLFLLGLYIGRNRLYAKLEENRGALNKICLYGFGIGLPASVAYAWSAMNSQPLGLVAHAALNAVSIVPLGLAYAAAICLWYMKNRERAVFRALAAPGRMALTNYIMQSVLGIVIFYGIGFGFGARTGLAYAELAAVGVFVFQISYSYLWLANYRFGPLEWIWRMLTYGKRLKLTK